MKDRFRRLHVFDGMLVTDTDWNTITEYQRFKDQLQARMLHGAGVVAHYTDGLLVRGSDPPGMRVEVYPGLAIDGEGNELYLDQRVQLPIDVDGLSRGGQPYSGPVFVLMTYDEQPDDFAASEVDPRATGHSRVEEGARLRISPTAAGPADIELARVYIGPDVRQIIDAPAGEAAGPGHIDRRFVPFVGQRAAAPRGAERHTLVTTLRERHKLLGRWLLDFDVTEAQLPRPSLLGAVTLLLSGSVGQRGLISHLAGLTAYEEEMGKILKRRTGEWERVWVSRPYKAYAEALKKASGALRALDVDPTPIFGGERTRQECHRAVELYRAINGPLSRLTDELPDLLERGAASGPLYKEMTEKELAAWAGEPPHRMALEGRPFVLVDRLEPTNASSVETHYFLVDAGANDVVQGTTPAMYPDGTRVTDRGIAYRKGSVYFHVNNMTPGRDLLIVRRVEYRELDVQEEVRLDEQPVGVWEIEGDDKAHQWRNVTFGVDREFVVGPRPRLRLSLREGSSPSNMYRFWFYQAV